MIDRHAIPVNSRTVLVVCRGLAGVDSVERRLRDQDCRAVVLFDDPRVEERLANNPRIAALGYLEPPLSCFAVADRVTALLAKVNSWLRNLHSGQHFDVELLYWPQVVEGGYTTQRIQDTLLLATSFEHHLDAYDADAVWLVFDRSRLWEHSVYLGVARGRHLPVTVLDRSPARALIAAAWTWLRPVAVEGVLLIRSVTTRLQRELSRIGEAPHKPLVALQVCSDAPKHLEPTKALMTALLRNGFDTEAVCWQASSGAAFLRESGLRVVELERLVPWKEYFAGLALALGFALRTWLNRGSFLQHEPPDIREALWPSVWAFTWELPSRCRLASAAQQYWKQSRALAFRQWTTFLTEGRVFGEAAKRNSGSMSFALSVLGYPEKEPYETVMEPVGLRLAFGPRHAAYYRRHGVPEQHIADLGRDSFDWARSFAAKRTQAESRAALGVRANDFCVLLDAAYAIRGYQSIGELMQLVSAVVSALGGVSGISLAIKPHPNHKAGLLEDFLDSRSYDNLIHVPQHLFAADVLNAADVLITKNSTMGLEAAAMGRPVISVQLDHDRRLTTNGDAAYYIDSLEQLQMLLHKFATDLPFRMEWVAAEQARLKTVTDVSPRKDSEYVWNAAVNALAAALSQTVDAVSA